jgi:hypothetical protein
MKAHSASCNTFYDLDFNNATKADLGRNMSYSVSVCSLCTSTIFHFGFLDHLTPLVHMMRTASPSNAFSTDPISFEEAKASQSNGDGFFMLSLCANVKVFLMVI